MRRFATWVAVATLATQATAHDYLLGELAIIHPFSYETPTTARAVGGYLSIANTGTTDARLIAVKADFPRVMMHTSDVEDGVALMTHLEDGIVIPAGQVVTLGPGGTHVMFMGLQAPLAVGDEIPATLVFDGLGEIDIVFPVEARDDLHDAKMDHDDNHADH